MTKRQAGEPITIANVDAILTFLPKLESFPSDQVVIRRPSAEKQADGTFDLDLSLQYHPLIRTLQQSLHAQHFIQPFDWGSFQQNAVDLSNDPAAVARADLSTCVKLLTLHVRKDRFCSGHLGSMIVSGHIVAVLRRLSKLRDELGSDGVALQL